MNDLGAGASLETVRAAALAEHYQKTMDLVTHHWERRSRQFVTLVGVLAGAVLVAFARPLLAPMLQSIILAYVPLKDKDLDTLKALSPVAADLLLAFLVVSVFYLTASLVSRSNIINGYYRYLEDIEPEIRRAFQIPQGQVAFTREGSFFEATGSRISWLIARCYRAVLGALLIIFFAARLFFDFPQDLPSLEGADRVVVLKWLAKTFLFGIDLLIVVPTLWLFVRFSRLQAMPKAGARTQD